MFGRATIGVEKNRNSPSANITRMPKKMVTASSRRYPDCTRRSRSDPISLGDRGTFSPTRFIKPMSDWRRGLFSASWSSLRVSSSRRRSIATALPGIITSAIAVMISDPKTKARRGRTIDTLHLDLDDLLDPYEPDGLHDDRGHEHHLPHAFAEEHVHVFGIDERECNREDGRQGKQHVARQPSMRRVDAHLAQDLEPFPDDVR